MQSYDCWPNQKKASLFSGINNEFELWLNRGERASTISIARMIGSHYWGQFALSGYFHMNDAKFDNKSRIKVNSSTEINASDPSLNKDIVNIKTGELTLTVIIPTLDRASVVQSTIDQVLQQSLNKFKLIIIDQSSDACAEDNRIFIESKHDDRISYLYSSVRNLPNARNEGLVRTQTDIVLFLDDDVILLSRDFLKAHVSAYSDQAVGGVVGRHVECELRMNSAKTACRVSWGGRTIFNLFGKERVEVQSCKGSNMSFRMEAVRQVGGFDRGTSLLEETDFSTRIRKAGWRLMFEPAAELIHLSTPSGGVREKNIMATEKRRFSATAYYIRKHRGNIGMLPFLVVFGMIALKKAISLRRPGAIFVLLGGILEGYRAAGKKIDDGLPYLPKQTYPLD